MSIGPVVTIDQFQADPEYGTTVEGHHKYSAQVGLIGRALGSNQIGINLTEVPPGKCAYPRHFHYINDEMFLIISGTGTLHYGDEDHPLAPMNLVFVPSGTGIPFQIDNTVSDLLRYLALSSLVQADVFVYPDSGKIGMMAGAAPYRDLAEGDLPPLRKWVWEDTDLGYYDGEPD